MVVKRAGDCNTGNPSGSFTTISHPLADSGVVSQLTPQGRLLPPPPPDGPGVPPSPLHPVSPHTAPSCGIKSAATNHLAPRPVKEIRKA
jgi:hypothetical protein